MEYVSAIVFTLLLMFSEDKSKVILLDNNVSDSSIIINNEAGSYRLSDQDSVVDLAKDKKEYKPKHISKKELYKKYGNITDTQKYKPTSILIYFDNGKYTLNITSQKILQRMKNEILKKGSCAITIIGHSDRKGDDALNKKLSLKRANEVKNLIESFGLTNIVDIRVVSYGENDPIVKTADGVSEAQNRRVEILIR